MTVDCVFATLLNDATLQSDDFIKQTPNLIVKPTHSEYTDDTEMEENMFCKTFAVSASCNTTCMLYAWNQFDSLDEACLLRNRDERILKFKQ